MSGASGLDENVQGEEEDLEDKNSSGELRWMSRAHISDPEAETCSVTESSVDDFHRLAAKLGLINSLIRER